MVCIEWPFLGAFILMLAPSLGGRWAIGQQEEVSPLVVPALACVPAERSIEGRAEVGSVALEESIFCVVPDDRGRAYFLGRHSAAAWSLYSADISCLADGSVGTCVELSVPTNAAGRLLQYGPFAVSSGGAQLVYEAKGEEDDSAQLFMRWIGPGSPSLEPVRVTRGGGRNFAPAVSAEGRTIAYCSDAETLAAGGSVSRVGVYIVEVSFGSDGDGPEMTASGARLVSLSSEGDIANGDCGSEVPYVGPSISDDGRYVAFASCATNLVAGDNNQEWDIYLRDLQLGETQVVGRANGGDMLVTGAIHGSVTRNGEFVVYQSNSDGTGSGGRTAHKQIYRWERASSMVRLVSVGHDGRPAGGHCWPPAASGSIRNPFFHIFGPTRIQ